MLNPYQLPLSPEMEAYVRRKALEIEQMCTNEKTIYSYPLLLQWAKQSNRQAYRIKKLIDEGVSEESIEEIQHILLHQVAFGIVFEIDL